jgi:transforming growth factor-beta-induced protein
MLNRIKSTLAAILLTLTLGSVVNQAQPAMANQSSPKATTQVPIKMAPLPTIAEAAIATPQLSSLIRFVKTAKLVETLNGSGLYTVFAPTNSAFAKLAKDPHDPKSVQMTLDALDKNPSLGAILGYHVVKGNLISEDLTNSRKLETIQGQTLTVKVSGKTIQLVTDSGSPVATVIKGDIVARNGVVHVIDRVLIKKESTKLYQAPANLTTFYKVLGATGLDKALMDGKTYTVFAPTNNAFAALTSKPNDSKVVETELAQLLQNKKAVRRILRKHIYLGKTLAKDLKDNQVITNILGESFKVNITSGKVFLTDIKSGTKVQILQTDLSTPFKGIQHSINGVFTK